MSPNLVVLMTDQQRHDALSCHGGLARTPHLDRLAGESIDLPLHFSQAPVCVPSRSTMFTGRYPQGTGVYENDSRIPPEQLHLFRSLRAAGYHLAYLGKDHLFPGDPRSIVDEYDDLHSEPDHPRAAEYRDFRAAAQRRLQDIGCYASACAHDFPDELTSTGRIGAATVRAIREAPGDRPFFVVGSFHDPHAPHLAPERFVQALEGAEVRIPDVSADPIAGKHHRFGVKRLAQNSDRASEADKRHYLTVYAAMVMAVDEQVGRILREIEDRKDGRGTIVIFTSDHGDFGFEHGMCKKDLVLLDCLLHVPFLIRLPAAMRSGGPIATSISEHADLVPTLLDLACCPIPASVQGRSLLPWLTGRTPTHRDRTHAAICPPGSVSPYRDLGTFLADWKRAQEGGEPAHLRWTRSYNIPGDHCQGVRTARWRYTRYADGFEELYDHAEDPGETRNVAADHRDVCAVLSTDLRFHDEQRRTPETRLAAPDR